MIEYIVDLPWQFIFVTIFYVIGAYYLGRKNGYNEGYRQGFMEGQWRNK